jgi:hypothetical protein
MKDSGWQPIGKPKHGAGWRRVWRSGDRRFVAVVALKKMPWTGTQSAVWCGFVVGGVRRSRMSDAEQSMFRRFECEYESADAAEVRQVMEQSVLDMFAK